MANRREVAVNKGGVWSIEERGVGNRKGAWTIERDMINEGCGLEGEVECEMGISRASSDIGCHLKCQSANSKTRAIMYFYP